MYDLEDLISDYDFVSYYLEYVFPKLLDKKNR